MVGRRTELSTISLFTGAGGLDLGLEAAGFETKLCIELDANARTTLRENRPSWDLSDRADIHTYKPQEILSLSGLRQEQAFLVAGGPPCQPFSKSGYWANNGNKRMEDPRADTLKAFMDVVGAALPRVFLLENVRGIAYRGKNDGLAYIKRRTRAVNKEHSVHYNPNIWQLNAADHGVPQIRERIFIVAVRNGQEVDPPRARFRRRDNEVEPSDRMPSFRTAWDAIGDLDVDDWPRELALTGKWGDLLPSIPEGHNYLWHTQRGGGKPLFGWRTRYWSFLLKLAKDKPSWTVQAEPGPATGPFHWRNRGLSLRELCRIQTFPDTYCISGSRRAAQRQIGNAVPPLLAEVIGLEIRKQVLGERLIRRPRLMLPGESTPPRPERVTAVPRKYLALVGSHSDHPGTGNGPGAMSRRARSADD